MEDLQFDSKDIYLMNPKTGDIVGLHAIGLNDSEWDEVALDGTVTKRTGFRVEEQWGNPYDRFLNFTGNSFRVFEDLDKTALQFVNDGWVDLDTAKVNKFVKLTVELLKHKYLYYELNRFEISDYEYDMQEISWKKLGEEIGIPMDEYPEWIDSCSNHKLYYRGKELAEKAVKEGRTRQ